MAVPGRVRAKIDTILPADLEASAWLMWAVLEPLARGTEDQFLTKGRSEGKPFTPQFVPVRPGSVRR